MTVSFRNVDASPRDPVRTWPYEGLVEVMERGLIGDWRPILAELRRDPWGAVARKVERWAAQSPEEPASPFFSLVIARARQDAQEQERAEVARRVREAVDRSGLTGSEFALHIGTSASRLSTYAHGHVMPSASMLLRIERVAELLRPLRGRFAGADLTDELLAAPADRCVDD